MQERSFKIKEKNCKMRVTGILVTLEMGDEDLF